MQFRLKPLSVGCGKAKVLAVAFKCVSVHTSGLGGAGTQSGSCVAGGGGSKDRGIPLMALLLANKSVIVKLCPDLAHVNGL